jgi:LacI family transcriptional regulator
MNQAAPKRQTAGPKLSVYLAMQGLRQRLALGVARYARVRREWSIYLVDDSDLVSALENGEPVDGVLVLSTAMAPIEAAVRREIPAVNLATSSDWYPIPSVVEDNIAVGRMAARFFLDRGYKHFAYSGLERTTAYSRRRGEGFCRGVEQAGLGPVHLREIPSITGVAGAAAEAEWIRSLPKPLALLTCNDVRGGQLVRACERSGIMVPEEVSVLGVDNDRTLCELMDTPLSSIEMDHFRQGFEASRLLDRVMHGEQATSPEPIQPLAVVERQSTDILAVEDPAVAAAIRFIRSEHGRSISVEDIAQHVAVSRRSLERRFREALDRSPRQELVRFRIDRAQKLLRETDLTVTSIAEACGFPNQPYFTRSFLRETGQNPTDYRRIHQDTYLP